MSVEHGAKGQQEQQAGEEKPRIIIDEDWKEQVRREKELAKRMREQERRQEQAERQPPPASFALLVNTFATQAAVSLGAVPNPVTGKRETNLAEAKHFIDMLSVLEEKTRGNLSPDEDQLLKQVLFELRMSYVEAKGRQGQSRS